MENLTPRQIVEALDKYIVGQKDAKKAVAIAIRNRWRRQQLEGEMKEEVLPKNIIMIGPTGVGKTEIARRLSALVKAPFMKVEASKFTEVGYVGRDVESMIRDLADNALNMVKMEKLEAVRPRAAERVTERLLDLLLPHTSPAHDEEERERRESIRKKFRKKLEKRELEDREIELSVEQKRMPSIDIFSNQGMETMGVDFQNLFERLVPSRRTERKMKVRDAREILLKEESEKLLDMEEATREALERVQSSGIIFLDELDKVSGTFTAKGGGPDVSREGVQRDLLPIVEGSTVATRYGHVQTDHILFIASGAFHLSKPSDLIPELQGRFPIRVELSALGKSEFLRILTEPKNALTKQYEALLAAEDVTVTFEEGALERMAEIAEEVNSRTMNIGARRLHTIMEKVLEEAMFDAPDTLQGQLTVDAEFIDDRLANIVEDDDLSRYIL